MQTFLSDPPNLLISHLLCLTRSCSAEHAPGSVQVRQLQKEASFCRLTRGRTTLQVFGRNRIEDALASLFAALSNGLLFFSVILLQYVPGLFAEPFNKEAFTLLFCSCYVHACIHPRSLASGNTQLFVFFITQAVLFCSQQHNAHGR